MSVATLAFAIAGGASVRAQAPPVATVQTMPRPTPDADALANAMRRLADNPRDVDALLTAGELSLKVGDPSGAASLFKRAEQVDPANGRVRAGMASILVRSERPGEALRYFNQAEGFGFDPRRFASDRGLAYDLIGQQERAQRDYRLALKADPDDDETIRRYALSLGISGKQDAALAQIDTLLRKSDRGAWRARAFILAMNGDVAGATKIATSMIPGIAKGLQPFFIRLPTLDAVDRAFAVNFGEVSPTPERLADARLTPALAPLALEPRPATALAATTPPPTKADSKKRKRERRHRGPIDRIEVASAAPKIATLPPPPGFGSAGASPTDPIRNAPAAKPPVALVSNTVAIPTSSAPKAVVRRTIAPADTVPLQRNEALRVEALRATAQRRTRSVAPPATGASTLPSTASAVAVAAPTPSVARTPTPTSVRLAPVRIVSVEPLSPTARAVSTVASPAASTKLAQTASSSPGQGPAPSVASASQQPPTPSLNAAATLAERKSTVPNTPAVDQIASGPSPAPGGNTMPSVVASAIPAPAKEVASAAPLPVAPRMSEDSILAKIVAGISIPGYELGVGPPPAPPATEIADATPVPGSANVQAKPAELDAAAAEKKRAEESAAKKAEDDRVAAAKKEKERAALAAKKRADAKALADKKAADANALAVKKAAYEKAVATKGAAEEKKAAKADPARIWVQIAGGAYEGDLPKAWAAVKAKASALSGRQGYSTPLRATNRVVTGPFKTNDAAQAFVNTLGKQGVSAFTFTSAAGQKVTRLPAK